MAEIVWSGIGRPTKLPSGARTSPRSRLSATLAEDGVRLMAWDFSTDPEFQEKLDWVQEFCREEVEPLEFVFPYAVRSPDPKVKAYVRGLQQQVKDQGLWAIFLDRELGGPGFGQLNLALLNEVIGRYPSAPQMFGAAAPDTGNMEMLAAYGTEEQKKRWLEPLMNQEMFSAYSMTEPQGGSDPNLFKTHAVRDGEEWVINGEKWFTSAGRVADILFVMCTNRSEEHTSELQSHVNLVCRLLLEKKKDRNTYPLTSSYPVRTCRDCRDG